MKSIIWLEPIGNVWSTECGKYRIYREGNDYTPQRLKSSTATISRSIVERVWRSVGVDCPTLQDAQASINQYHCEAHNVVLA